MFEQEVKQVRWKLGLTQVQLASLLDCTEHSVQNWESGRVTPKFSVVLACRWLQEHPEYIDHAIIFEEAAREREES